MNKVKAGLVFGAIVLFAVAAQAGFGVIEPTQCTLTALNLF